MRWLLLGIWLGAMVGCGDAPATAWAQADTVSNVRAG